uniref:NHL repeat containing protein-like protein n=1 Tax=Adineta vaga TaxID=104782 RepID=B3G4G9_ADIVA|nr:NHL repeat containing protein-like protein [Adineta vaga]
MWNLNHFIIIFLLFLIFNNEALATSTNQPNLSTTAVWDRNGITIANRSIVGDYPRVIFVDINNTIYVTNQGKILIWHNDSINPTKIMPVNFSSSMGLFVTLNGNIYVNDGLFSGQVKRWTLKTNTSDIVMNVYSSCYSLFVDINDNLYCSIHMYNRVVKRDLTSSSMETITVAGTGRPGYESNELENPRGIFVDTNFDLYVADCFNNRVQLFQLGETNAITVAGQGSVDSALVLYCPNDIILDSDKYLWILEQTNFRIVREGPYGFRCIIGCYRQGSQSNRLDSSFTFGMNGFGNIFVADVGNHRVQKFQLIKITPAVPFNQPRFCQTATWNRYAITIANQSIVGKDPTVMFVDTKNTIYGANYEKSEILIWHNDSLTPTKIISGNFSHPSSLFVTLNGDIYIDDGDVGNQVKRLKSNTNTFDNVMNVYSSCYGLFVDINDNLYCSMLYHHQVVKRDLNSPSMEMITVAGTGTKGFNFSELNGPLGIFVDINLDIFVADCSNHRIQLFQSGEKNAKIIVGFDFALSLVKDISLSYPSHVILDSDKYLFIVDRANSRIVGDGPHGFRCLVGCDKESIQSNQLNLLTTVSFDTFGNMFVVNQVMNRFLKFQFFENSCTSPFNQPKFCAKPVWDRIGKTFTTEITLGINPTAIFINEKNSIYAINREKKQILIWHKNSTDPSMIISTDFYNISSLFVSLNDDIYIDNGVNGRVKKWISKRNTFVNAMNVFSPCVSLFVDRNDYLYCSMSNFHQIIKIYMHERAMTWIAVAGTGEAGFTSLDLDHPYGIFVDLKFDLYVADCGNNRIQRYLSGNINGITEVGSTSARHTLALSCPTEVTLDYQGFLFIVNSNNHRILRSGSNGIHCIIGCHHSGSTSTQLLFPFNIAFDSFGNLFAVDSGTNRILKFQYLKNSCDMSSMIKWTNLSTLTKNSPMYSQDCDWQSFYYDAFQVKVPENRYYTIRSNAKIDTYGYLYENEFDPLNPTENLLLKDDDGGYNGQFKFEIPLYNDMIYILLVTTFTPITVGDIEINIFGLKNVTIKRLTTSVIIQSTYSSELTTNSAKYCRDYKKPNYYYETLEINVKKTGSYVLWSKSEIDTYGYLYKDDFDPLQPFGNLITQHNGKCNQGQLKFFIDIEANTKYILVVTTYYSNTTGNFTIFISGENNVTVQYFGMYLIQYLRTYMKINILDSKQRSCSIGDRCHFYTTTIGLPLDDILRGEIQPNATLSTQLVSIQISAGLTILMFIGGLVNSIFSYLTFKNREVRQVGCGLYLYASSITSLLTISMFLVNFWFAVLTQINVSTSFSILHGGCIIIEPILKLFLNCDTWLNACIAIERAIQVLKGIHFNRNKSKRVARWIIFILPFCIMVSLIHEPLHRNMFEYKTETIKAYVNKTESDSIDVIKSEKNKRLIETIYQSTTDRHVYGVSFVILLLFNNTILLFYFFILLFHLLLIYFRLYLLFLEVHDKNQ